MRVELPFGREMLPVEVPDNATVLLPSAVRPLADQTGAVVDALRRPLAGSSLRERVRAGQRVAIVISDITRPVPNQLLLEPVLAELAAAGVADSDITIVNGTGLHRGNSEAELAEMLGLDIPQRYAIVQHDARDRSTLVEVGRSKGVPVELCRAYVDTDVRIVVGFVEPHLFAGYSGGPKGVMPGVAGAGIVISNHGAPNLAHPKATWCVMDGNPVVQEIRAVVDLLPPDFLLNVTLDSQRRLSGVFAGDMYPAHEAAIEQAARQYQAPVSHPYDIVVVTNMGYPPDTTLYQSVKGMSVAAQGVREGGAILLVAGCEEGIGSRDYEEGLLAAESPAALLDRILHTEQPRHDQWQIQCQAMVQTKARVLLHSKLTPRQTRAAHLEYAADASQALLELVKDARERGNEGSVLVMPYGQLTVPVIH
ncbi:MAG TPA: nickel-dependent lactate racemase [Dehalococcoidia bacterium]|nr:nickel-dependent lactate racemase [Dehalococcoidia bacterium]